MLFFFKRRFNYRYFKCGTYPVDKDSLIISSQGLDAPVFNWSRIKPETYKTVDRKVIVKDELRNFLAVKSKTLS